MLFLTLEHCYLLGYILKAKAMNLSFANLQDMQDMRDCYDSLLSAAAATANSAYGMFQQISLTS